MSICEFGCNPILLVTASIKKWMVESNLSEKNGSVEKVILSCTECKGMKNKLEVLISFFERQEL